MSDTAAGTFTLNGVIYPAQITEGKIVDPDGFPYQKGSVGLAALLEGSQPKETETPPIRYYAGNTEPCLPELNQPDVDVWKALHDKIESDLCSPEIWSEGHDPLNATERRIFNNLSEKFATLTSITSITESEQ